ncbi:MAG: pantoate--beta-alanine ligase [Caulobacteraceae bacterium]
MTSSFLPIVRSVSSLQGHVKAWRERGHTVALVPTMGALHDGHMSLIKLARIQADKVIATVFVNPTQFGPNEDFDAYPRNEAADAQRLSDAHCDLMYAPTAAEMYPPGFATSISVGGVSGGLDGAARPGHFDGVATVVSKLLIQASPDVAIFGEKDYQQLQVIKRVTRDLDLKVKIIGAAIARAPDGLALSSRNVYLSEHERAVAPRLHLVLQEAAGSLKGGAAVSKVEANAVEALLQMGFDKVDYVEVRGADDLTPADPGAISGPSRVLAAAWLGRTRLIDNLAADPARPAPVAA